MPGGYLEARGGFEALKPSGGSASNPISAGIFTGAHEHTMADGYLWTTSGGGVTFSANLAQRGYFDLWPVAASTQNNDAIYVGADYKFSRVVFYVGQGTKGAVVPTFVYEYPTASDWSTTGSLTTTSTPDWTTVGEQGFEFADPGSAWIRSVRNGVYGYFVRIRMSAENDGFTTKCTQTTQRVYSDWAGARQIYVTSADASAATNNGVLKYYGQSSASAVSWQSVSTALFSGGYARARFASYRNLLYLVNGKEQKRWDNNALADVGFSKPTSSGATVNVAGAGNLTGLFQYAITYGYGPAGEWGESNELALGNTGAVPAKSAVWTLNLTSIPATAEIIYFYRSTDLTGPSASERTAFPYFRIQAITRDATGSFPTTATDNTLAFPFPPVELDIAVNTPPARCKFVTVHKNRMFLGNNNQFPGRVWWSEPFQAEAFNQDENYADFTRSTGGQVSGMAEFQDRVVVFTEDKMFGIENVDQDVPSIYEIENVGCIAADSLQTGFGVLCWLARNGVYVWDGQNPPSRVSDNMSTAFGKMSYEKHGLSRAALHNRLYDIYLIDANNNELASPRFRYDLVTRTWARLSPASAVKWGPLTTVTAPTAHADAGVRHPLYGQTALTASDFAIYLGEQTTQDNGSNYTCLAYVHFGPYGLAEYTLDSCYAYYDTDTGWGTPVLNNATASAIGSTAGSPVNMSVDGASDYTRIKGVYSEGTLGTGDVVVGFTAVSASGGTVGSQRLLSVGIDGSGASSLWGQS